MKVATCSIVKLENNYLKEFVEYYKTIGFDHIFIYDNNNEYDEHPEDVLQEYIDSGFVTVIDYRNQIKYPMNIALQEAFQNCWNEYKNKYDWILFCDNDEFLNFSKDKNVKEYLSHKEFNNIDIIRINWKCYDDNDLIYYDDRPLKERFTRCCNDNPLEFEENKHIKSFIHNTAKDKLILFEKRPAHSPNFNEKLNVCKNNGELININEYLKYNIDVTDKNEDINYDLCWLDHYRMKTIDEYINNKIKKLSENGYKKIAFSSYIFFKYNKYTKEKEEIYLDYIKKNSKNVVYTCIIGDYDKLNEVSYITPGWDYICFTDNKELKSDIWKIIYIDDNMINNINYLYLHRKDKNYNQYINRAIKFLGYKYLEDYDFSLYIDGNFTITGNLNEFKNIYIDIPGSYKYIIWILNHSKRNCIYDEINQCIELNKDNIDKLEYLKNYFIENNMPKNYGLTHNCFIGRYHFEQESINLSNIINNAIMNFTVRDQCLFMYIIWKLNIKDNICLLNNWIVNRYINYYDADGSHKKSIKVKG